MACVLAAGLGAAGCEPAADTGAVQEPSGPGGEQVAPEAQEAPLSLRIPILAVMVGSTNRSSFEIFRAAASSATLSDDDWLRVGQAAVDLVGDASLITMAGTGPKDAAWVADPKWMRLSADMQAASFAVGVAADAKDRAALTEATARLAQSCQSCHLEFSPHLVTSQPGAEALPPDR
jgi:hypothetical protein